MNTSEITLALVRLSDSRRLSAFSRAVKIDRRTLQRLVNGAGEPNPSTVKVLAAELRKARWAA